MTHKPSVVFVQWSWCRWCVCVWRDSCCRAVWLLDGLLTFHMLLCYCWRDIMVLGALGAR